MSRMRETNLRSKAAIAEGGRGNECVCGEWKERRLGKEEEGKNERAAGDDDENDARFGADIPLGKVRLFAIKAQVRESRFCF